MKNYFLLSLLFFINAVAAQTTERKNVQGEITVPEGFQPDGIHIYNKVSGYGTSSNAEGSFQLPMATGDTLHFSAVQYEALEVVVTEAVIETGLLEVEIREGLNELPEIYIRSHDLTGNINEDLERIEVFEIPAFPSMEELEKLPANSSSPRNAVMNEIGGGANHLDLIIKGIKYLLPKRKKKEAPPRTEWTAHQQVGLEKELRSRFDDGFFLDNFGIPVAEISSFVGFVAKKGFSESLLRADKELELIQFLMEKSEAYKPGN